MNEKRNEGGRVVVAWFLFSRHSLLLAPPPPLASLGPGSYFGELALLRHAPRAATVTAVSAASLLVLPRAGFEALLGPARARLCWAGWAAP